MALRVKCSAPGCGAVFEVSDDQAGETVLCPECGAGMEVPSGEEDHFGDIKAAAGQEGKVLHPARQQCPSCGATLGVRVAICPQCGADIRTGAVTQVTRRKVRDWTPFLIGGGIAVSLVVLVVLIVVAAGLLKERKQQTELATREQQPETAQPVDGEPVEVLPHVELAEADFGTLGRQEQQIAESVRTYRTRLREALGQIHESDATKAATLWADLAAFCRENNLPAEADLCWIRAARLAPRSASVNDRLGRTETFRGHAVTPEQKQFLEGLRPTIRLQNQSATLSDHTVKVGDAAAQAFGWSDQPVVRVDAGSVRIAVAPAGNSTEGTHAITLPVQDGLGYTVTFRDPAAAPGLSFTELENLFTAVMGTGDAEGTSVERNWQNEVTLARSGRLVLTGTADVPLSMALVAPGVLAVSGLLTQEAGASGDGAVFWGSQEDPILFRINTEAKSAAFTEGTFCVVRRDLADGLMGVLATAHGDAADAWAYRQLAARARRQARADVEKEARGDFAAPWRALEANWEEMTLLKAEVDRQMQCIDHAARRPAGIDNARALGLSDRAANLYLNWERFRPALTSLTGDCADLLIEVAGPQQQVTEPIEDQGPAAGTRGPRGPRRRTGHAGVTAYVPTAREMIYSSAPGVHGGVPITIPTPTSPLAPNSPRLDEEARRYGLMKMLAVLPDDQALRHARNYWNGLDYDGKVTALVSLEQVASPQVVAFLAELTQELSDVDVVVAALLSLGSIGTPEALQHTETPTVHQEIRWAAVVAHVIAGRPKALDDLPHTLSSAGEDARKMILSFLADTDAPATLPALSAAIDACTDAESRARIAAALVRIGGHAAMAELARLMESAQDLYPALLPSVAPEDALLLVRPIGTAVARGEGTPETVSFLLEHGGPAGRAFLRAAAVNHGSPAALSALIELGDTESIRTLLDTYHHTTIDTLKQVRGHWLVTDQKPDGWQWNSGIDSPAAGGYLRTVLEESKDPKVRLGAAWMMMQVGEPPDARQLLTLVEMPEPETGVRRPRGTQADAPERSARGTRGGSGRGMSAAGTQTRRPAGEYAPEGFTEPAGRPRIPSDLQMDDKPALYALGLLTRVGDASIAQELRTLIDSCPDEEVVRAMFLTIAAIGGPQDIEFLREQALVRADTYANTADVAAELHGRLVALAALGRARDADFLPRLDQMLDEAPPADDAITDVADYDTLNAWWQTRLRQEVCDTIVGVCTEKQLFELTGNGDLQRRLTDRLQRLIENPGGGGSSLADARDRLKASALRAYARCASAYDGNTLLLLKHVALALSAPGSPASRAPASRLASGTRTQARDDMTDDSLDYALRDAVVRVALHGGGPNVLQEVRGILPAAGQTSEAWGRLLCDLAAAPSPQFFELVNMVSGSLTDESRQRVFETARSRVDKSDRGYALFVAGMIRRPTQDRTVEDEAAVDMVVSAEEAQELMEMPPEAIEMMREQERIEDEVRMGALGVRDRVPAGRRRTQEKREQKAYSRLGSRRQGLWAYSLEDTAEDIRILRRKWALVEHIFECGPTAVAVAIQDEQLFNHRDFGPEIAVRYARMSNAARSFVLQNMRDLLIGETEVVPAGPRSRTAQLVRREAALTARRSATLVLRRLGDDQAAAVLYDALVGPPTERIEIPLLPGDDPVAPPDIEPGRPGARRGGEVDEGIVYVARALGSMGHVDLLRAALNAPGRSLFDRNSTGVQTAALEGMVFLPDRMQALAVLTELFGLAGTPELRNAVSTAILKTLQRTLPA